MLKFFKKHWVKISFIVGILLIAVSLVVIFFLFGERKDEIAKMPVVANVSAPAAPGVKTWTDLYAVSIDNQIDARPASGLNQAEFVIEAPVEGGISRFLAFFARGNSVPEIGPVRSARPYFLDWVKDAGPALFVHIGGSPEAMARIASDPVLLVTDADGIGAAGVFFSRDDARVAPHNAYIASKDVETLFFKRSPTPRPVTGWSFVSEPDASKLGSGGDVKIKFGDPANSVVWSYDKTNNDYTRASGGKADKTKDGALITAKNVAVIYTDVKSIDTDDRKSVRTTGDGVAKVYVNGNEIDGTWKCDGSSLPRFYDASGNEIIFTEGNVWVEVVSGA
jgi:Protein of unknown function (DUF3048) N-terminal domain/Protein of unknown function (DUF3048) C-terminal domain